MISFKGLRGSDWEWAGKGLLGQGNVTQLTGDDYMGVH